MLSRWSGLIRQNSDDIATLMCLESGKPKTESKGEVFYAVSFVDMYASMQTSGQVLPAQTDTHLLLATKEVIQCSYLSNVETIGQTQHSFILIFCQ